MSYKGNFINCFIQIGGDWAFPFRLSIASKSVMTYTTFYIEIVSPRHPSTRALKDITFKLDQRK